MKVCPKNEIYDAVQYSDGMEDGFKLIFHGGTFRFWFIGEEQFDYKRLEKKIPFIKINNVDEFSHHWNPLYLSDKSWILTDWLGRKDVYTDKEFRQKFIEIEEDD